MSCVYNYYIIICEFNYAIRMNTFVQKIITDFLKNKTIIEIEFSSTIQYKYKIK